MSPSQWKLLWLLWHSLSNFLDLFFSMTIVSFWYMFALIVSVFFFFFFFLASLEWKLPEDESRSFCLLCSGLCPLRLQRCPAPLGAQETLVDWVQKIKFSKQQPHSPLVYILTLLNFSIQPLMLFIIVDFLILCLLSGIKPYKLSSCFCLLWRDNWT